ncbi:uncharacterized protein LOC117649244 [Thrips palmi]|uniref:Uncharacterized protein LOC117649244 n=1 Tax=Thrips palmi TaxID=161013 RepID=A0A6P8Z5J3_THRPL|nr:uncharacterized protein LOC117649244 [Thrips palmi]
MEVTWIVLVLTVFQSEAASLQGRKAGHLTGEVVAIYECPDFEGNSFRFGRNLTRLKGPNGEFGASTSFDVLRGTKSITKGNIRFEFCSQGVTKICENYSNWRIGKDGCALWTNKFTMWNKFVDTIHPRFECPFREGHYVVTNATLDVRKLELIAVEDREWIATVQAYGDKEEPWVCAVFHVKLYRTGRRRAPL